MLYNRDFGKLKDQNITYAPRNVEIDKTWYCPASEEQLMSLGWMKIIDTPYPTDGKSYSGKWETIDMQIVKVWTEIPQPEPEPLTPVQQRELAYRTEKLIRYGNAIITVDEANKLFAEYFAEGKSEKYEELRTLIAAAKAEIRERYPDIVNEESIEEEIQEEFNDEVNKEEGGNE